MSVIRTEGLVHRYGRVEALGDVALEVPEGALYALLGPNGAGKTTLLRILAGLLRPTSGRATILGREVGALTAEDRTEIAYMGEGVTLPGWMTMGQLEAYLAPLYPGWDEGLAAELRTRFGLDPGRRIRALSRGERMKAAMLSVLAARPRVLLLDEPFTGMDALVKDDLVRGLLGFAGDHGCTTLVSSHDIAELEALADWVGFLDSGSLLLSEPMEAVRARFRRVEVVSAGSGPGRSALPPDWLAVESSGPRTSFIAAVDPASGGEAALRAHFPGATRLELRPPTLRELFVALAAAGRARARPEEVAA